MVGVRSLIRYSYSKIYTILRRNLDFHALIFLLQSFDSNLFSFISDFELRSFKIVLKQNLENKEASTYSTNFKAVGSVPMNPLFVTLGMLPPLFVKPNKYRNRYADKYRE
jgi:hypothetical protein